MDVEQGTQAPTGAIAIEQESSGHRVLRLTGSVDTAVAMRFWSEHGRERVAVDGIEAGDVTFISSSGLSLLVMYVETSVAAGRRPVLRSSSGQVERLLERAGIASLLPRPDPGGGSPPRGGDASPPGPG